MGTPLFRLGPPDMELHTIRNYKFSEVSSAMQKAIRRADTQLAGYWALELWASGFGNYVWKRLLTVSAEDCWGLITAEVKALHDSYLIVNDNVPARKAKGRIFISKAVIILCAAKKSRDPDHLQNLVYDQLKGVDADALADDLRKAPEYIPIPRLRVRLPHPQGEGIRGHESAVLLHRARRTEAFSAGVV